jgi:hypothetical protein
MSVEAVVMGLEVFRLAIIPADRQFVSSIHNLNSNLSMLKTANENFEKLMLQIGDRLG